MKELLVQYAAYNVWANHRLIFALEKLDEEVLFRKIPSSFDSLYKTVLHIWDAESIWFQRMRLHDKIIRPSASFEPSMGDACNGWRHQSMQWEAYLRDDNFTEEVLESPLLYKNFKGEEFSQPVKEVLLHLFNHGTYHRGQLITMLHQVGVSPVPNTDFIAFARAPAN